MSRRTPPWPLLLLAGAATWVVACARSPLAVPVPAEFDRYGATSRTYHVWPRKPMFVEVRCRVDDPLVRNPHLDRRAFTLTWSGISPMQAAGDEVFLSVAALGTELETREYPVWLRRDGKAVELSHLTEEEIGAMSRERAGSVAGIAPSSLAARRTVERSFLHARVWLFWHGGIAFENTGRLRTFPALDAAVPIRVGTTAVVPNDREGMLNVTVPWDSACDRVRERSRR